MSCYLIKVENGHKVARSITSEEEYRKIRGSYEDWCSLTTPGMIRRAW